MNLAAIMAFTCMQVTYHELIKREANAHPSSSLGLQGECDGVFTDSICHIVCTIC